MFHHNAPVMRTSLDPHISLSESVQYPFSFQCNLAIECNLLDFDRSAKLFFDWNDYIQIHSTSEQ